MLDWLKKDRCKACGEERAIRYCLRKNKDIGWKCCNGYRADSKCPEACPYTPKKTDSSSPLPQIKSDSRTEFIDFLDRYIQFWIYMKVESLDNKTPHEISQSKEGKSKLREWLTGFSYPDYGIISLLNSNLNLDLTTPAETVSSPESLASDYLDALIALDWDKVVSFHSIGSDVSPEIYSLLLSELSKHLILKRVKSHSIINAGFTEDRKQSFVFCEINSKENWTFIFVQSNETWYLYQVIWGTLQDYYAQKTIFRQIALAISNKDKSALFKQLENASAKFPLCSDIQYYYGLYYLMCARTDDAKTAFQKAIALDESWQEPAFQLAMLYMNNKEYKTALLKWEQLAKQNPEDINVQNNVGICYLGLGQPDKAKTVWQDALKIDPNSEILKKNLEHVDNG